MKDVVLMGLGGILSFLILSDGATPPVNALPHPIPVSRLLDSEKSIAELKKQLEDTRKQLADSAEANSTLQSSIAQLGRQYSEVSKQLEETKQEPPAGKITPISPVQQENRIPVRQTYATAASCAGGSCGRGFGRRFLTRRM